MLIMGFFSNVGVCLQLIGVLLFAGGLVVTYVRNEPTLYSYATQISKAVLKKDYFEKKPEVPNVENNLIYNGATTSVTNALLEVSKALKTGNTKNAELILEGIPKNDLTLKDMTNIQSVRAGIFMTLGDLSSAKSIYQSILDTGTSSNAVFTGLGTIAAFEAFKNQFDSTKAIALLYESNDWYLKAIAGDNRPRALVTIYYNLFDNYRVLTGHFHQSEQGNLEKYKKLFLETNAKAGNPYKV